MNHITLDVTEIATITLNRPDRLNACSLEMADEINPTRSTDWKTRGAGHHRRGRAFVPAPILQCNAATAPITGGRGQLYRADARIIIR
jgi:2-(1,2-epoxy-1,2-dihydrophenyl)acetyl-CoA isomerase